MSFETEATYEDGVLRFNQPLPLREHERVRVCIEALAPRIRDSAGLIPFQGTAEALDYLLGPENDPWQSA